MSNYDNENGTGLEQQVSRNLKPLVRAGWEKSAIKKVTEKVHVAEKENQIWQIFCCKNSCNPCKCRAKCAVTLNKAIVPGKLSPIERF
jgi:hypothetical protein